MGGKKERAPRANHKDTVLAFYSEKARSSIQNELGCSIEFYLSNQPTAAANLGQDILYQEIDYINEEKNADKFKRDFRNINLVWEPVSFVRQLLYIFIFCIEEV
ncbi:uncharacterized protein LOC144567012 [Carex rostrata]